MNKKNIEIDTLENGLVLITQKISWVNSVSIHIAVKAGPRYESGKSAGLAHFLEHMLFEGTIKYPTPKSLAKSIERVGGKSAAWTDKEFVSYNVKVPKEYLENGISYLADILFHSALQEEFIEKEKNIITEEMKRSNDNPESEMWDVFMKHVWGKAQSLGKSTLGDITTLKQTNRKTLLAYLEEFYFPGNMVMSVVGNFSKSDLLKALHTHFDKSSQKTPSKMKKIIFQKPTNLIKKVSANTQQSQVVLGVVTGISYSHPDRFIMRVIADILGTGVSSRLFNKLVYELGIAYGTGVFNWMFQDTGMFCMYGGVSPKNAQATINAMFAEIKKLREELVGESELSLAKIQDISQMFYSLETPDALAYSYSSQWATEGRILYPEDIKNEINKVTPEDILRIAKKYLQEKNFVGIIRGAK